MQRCQIQNKGKFVRTRLVMLWTSPEDLRTRFSTQNETLVPHLVPESKTESYQWNHPAPRSPKKKKLWSAGKVMTTVFWDTERLLRVDFLDYGINVNWEYYATLLKWL